MNNILIIKKNLIFFFMLSFTFSLWVGFRGNTNDTQTYFNIFKEIQNYNNLLLSPTNFYYETGVEIGYGWYSYIMSYITSSSYVLFSTFSFLSFLFIYKTSDRMELDYPSVFLLYTSSAYFLMQQFMQMRQGLAIPMALFALTLLIKKDNLIKFILFSLLSISLHQTAIAVLFFGIIFNFIFLKMKMSLRQYKCFLLLIILFFVFLSKFLLIDMLTSYSSRLLSYSSSSYAEEIGLFRLPNIKSFLVFLLIFSLINQKIFSNKVFKIFMSLLALSVSFRIGFSDFAILSGRFSTAFSHVEIFLLPFIFYSFGKKIGCLMLLVYIIIQSITVYIYQAPYVLQSYTLPLH